MAELFELREFSLCLWALPGVSKFSLHAASWLNTSGSGWWVLRALRRLQRAGTGKQGHVMGSQGSLSCQELPLAIVSLGSGAAGTLTWICSLVLFKLPHQAEGTSTVRTGLSTLDYRGQADPRDIWWSYFRVYPYARCPMDDI